MMSMNDVVYITPNCGPNRGPVTSLVGRTLLLLVALAACTSPLLAQPGGPTQPFTWEAKVQHQTILPNGEEVIELQGNVIIKQGLVTITADQGTFYPAQQRATISGNVHIIQPGTTLTAPVADYNGVTGIATAPNGMTIREDGGTLTAGYGEHHNNRRISYFRNNVTLRDSNIVLTSASGTYFSAERRAIFEGNVTAVSDSGELTADRLTYWRNTEQSYAVGNVRLFSLSDSSVLTCDTLDHRPDVETFGLGNVALTSSRESAVLTGDSLRHRPQEEYTIVTGSPKLTQIDSTLRLVSPSKEEEEEPADTATAPPDSLAVVLDTIRRGDSLFTVRRDTTVITALKLERFAKDRKEFTATGDARIVRGTLEAVAEIARYFEDDEVVALGPGRSGRARGADTAAVASDTAGVVDGTGEPPADGDEMEEEFPEPVAGDPVPDIQEPIVWYEESQLTGDTITVFLEEKKLRTIDVVGSAFAISSGDVEERYDQLAAERLIFNVLLDTIRSIHANGAAASIYFIYENGAPNGLNRSSGDTIVIAFADGKASRVGIYGPRTRLEGEVIPEKDVAGRETVYRLSGFTRHERGDADDEPGEADSEPTGLDAAEPEGSSNESSEPTDMER